MRPDSLRSGNQSEFASVMRGSSVIVPRRSSRQALAIAGLCLLAVSGASAQEQPAAAPPMVETAAVKLSEVTTQTEFVGSVVAAQQVALIARVEGFLDEVNFTEGTFVKADTTAFVIEKDTYQAAVEGAQAQLESAKA